ncbi:alanyl-tRNA editing protein, partial [SAR202 cluster bacterium AC-409-J13_OGT_754m]|nr:alanyl-tRNA editing protein [SAR202 cluster bacterium AC-409-J13_OGT_754m]
NFVSEIEKKINHEVSKGRPVGVSILPREIAFGMPDLIRTKINLLPVGINEVRIVDINGLDVQADGGTHVSNTKEVGQINITGHESKGRINKRLRISIE